jgi:hypothetical protein
MSAWAITFTSAFQVGAGVIEPVGVQTLRHQGGPLLVVQVGALDAVAPKCGLGLGRAKVVELASCVLSRICSGLRVRLCRPHPACGLPI